jgi:excisionase family DNA binding protein
VTGNVIPFTPRPRRGDPADETGQRQPSHTAAHDASTHSLTVRAPSPILTAVYTVAEVATMLSLSLGSTYQLVRAGQIPAKKMGGRWVIPKRRFHAWLDDLPEATTEDIQRELHRLNRAT